MRYRSLLERTIVCRAALHALAPMHLEGRVIGLSGLMVDIDGLGGHVSVGDRLILSARDGHDIPAEIVGFAMATRSRCRLPRLTGSGRQRGAVPGRAEWTLRRWRWLHIRWRGDLGRGGMAGRGRQLRILAAAVVRVGGTSLMLPSPSRPSENEAKPGDWMEEQTCEQSADLRNAEYAGCDQAQAARATGLLSFALLAATCRS